MRQLSLDRYPELVLNEELPAIQPVTATTIEVTKREANRFRGSVRIARGEFYTVSQLDKLRIDVLNSPLP